MNKLLKQIKNAFILYFEPITIGQKRTPRKEILLSEINEVHRDELYRLMKETGLNLKGFTNSSFTLMRWAVEEVKTGRIIASVDLKNNHVKEVVLDALENVRSKSN